MSKERIWDDFLFGQSEDTPNELWVNCAKTGGGSRLEDCRKCPDCVREYEPDDMSTYGYIMCKNYWLKFPECRECGRRHPLRSWFSFMGLIGHYLHWKRRLSCKSLLWKVEWICFKDKVGWD